MTEKEPADDEELPDHGDDTSDVSGNDAIDSPTMLEITCYLVRIERDDVRDQDDEADFDQPAPRSQSGIAYRPCVRQEIIEVSMPIDIDITTRARAAAEYARAAGMGWDGLKKAAADYAGDRAANAMWSADDWQGTDGLCIDEAAEALNQSADWLRSLLERPVGGLAAGIGAPGPLAEAGAGVVATFVTAPITKPMGDTAKIIEIVGVVVGFLTGLHPLVLACAKPLAHNQIAELVAKGLEKAMSPVATHSGMSSADTRRVAAVFGRDRIDAAKEGPSQRDPATEDPQSPRKILLGPDADGDESAVGDATRATGDALNDP